MTWTYIYPVQTESSMVCGQSLHDRLRQNTDEVLNVLPIWLVGGNYWDQNLNPASHRPFISGAIGTTSVPGGGNVGIAGKIVNLPDGVTFLNAQIFARMTSTFDAIPEIYVDMVITGTGGQIRFTPIRYNAVDYGGVWISGDVALHLAAWGQQILTVYIYNTTAGNMTGYIQITGFKVWVTL